MKEEATNKNFWWFEKTYYQLISSRKSRGLDKSTLEGYYERHHILPKCMGGKDEENNFVLLTCREHIIAHILLYKMYPNNLKLTKAAMIMTSNSNGTKVSTRIAAELRETYGKLQIERNNQIRETSADGYVLNKSIRDKMSKSRLGHITSDITKNKISMSEKGKYVNSETRKRISDSYKDTEDRRKKLSKIGLEVMKDNSIRKRISNSLKGKINTQNTRGKLITNGTETYNSLIECAKENNISVRKLKQLIEILHQIIKL